MNEIPEPVFFDAPAPTKLTDIYQIYQGISNNQWIVGIGI